MITHNERERRFLQTLWHNRLFSQQNLTLTDGTRFEIRSCGLRGDSQTTNPDFSFASIYLPDNKVTLYGSIKIDTHSSHWREQGTMNRMEFGSVILHVVFNQDMVINQSEREVPTFVLRVTDEVAEKYDQLRKGGACPGYIGSIQSIHTDQILARVMSDRLKRKSEEVLSIYNSVGNDWSETAYICFMRAFGYREKKQEFETLARTIPLRYLLLHSNSLPQMEALLLGLAGCLEVQEPDSYTFELQNLYQELRNRHGLNPRYISWSGISVRPGSLPVQSIVRIAAILKREEIFIRKLLKGRKCKDFYAIFDIELSDYWKKHYAPSRLARINSSGMTLQKNQLLVINFVIPLLNTYGMVTNNEEIRARALDLYEEIPPEENRYVKEWSRGGYRSPNAFYSQALIQLSTEYCSYGLCGSCPVGIRQISEVLTSNNKNFNLG